MNNIEKIVELSNANLMQVEEYFNTTTGLDEQFYSETQLINILIAFLNQRKSHQTKPEKIKRSPLAGAFF